MTYGPDPTDAPASTSPGGSRQLRVLVVDDDAFDRQAVRRCLIQSNTCQAIDEADSAEQLLERIQGVRYDCVLLDYYIPGSDGTVLLEQIQKIAPETPVVMFTGRGDEEIAVELMKAGASDYLPKSALTTERVIASVRHAIELCRTAAAQRRAAEDLERQEERFRTLANAIPQMAWSVDASGVNWFNRRWYEYTGTTEADVQGWDAQSWVHPDHVQRVMEGLRRGIKRGEAWEDTFPMRGKDGAYRWFLSRAVPIRGADGNITEWLGTNTDVTDQMAAQAERDRLLAQEREARAEAERAVQARDQVLAFVAHDLRSPLSTITMSAEVLLNHPHAGNRDKGLEVIRRATGEMERLIRDLLDASRMESGGFAIEPVRTEVLPLLHQIREYASQQGKSRRVSVECEAEDVPPVWADPDRLMQVLSNLVGNALKFTPSGGVVTLGARRDGDQVVISVSDTGDGIPADDLPHIFNRFWQGGETAGGGAGLGLAICKGIIEAHGSRLDVESRPDEGTTMRFALPTNPS